METPLLLAWTQPREQPSSSSSKRCHKRARSMLSAYINRRRRREGTDRDLRGSDWTAKYTGTHWRHWEIASLSHLIYQDVNIFNAQTNQLKLDELYGIGRRDTVSSCVQQRESCASCYIQQFQSTFLKQKFPTFSNETSFVSLKQSTCISLQ